MVRKWVRQFNNGQTTNIHDKARSKRPSVVDEDLVEKVNEKFCENRWISFHKFQKMSWPQTMLPLGFENSYGGPQNKATS